MLRSSQTREEQTASGNQEGQVTRRQRAAGAQQNQQGQPGQPAQTAGAARPEQEVGGNRQLRDLPHDQDRGHRGRPRQAHLGRRAGRRQLRQERQGRHRLSAAHQGGARPHRRAGAHRDRLRPEARRPDRGRQPALRRGARRADRRSRAACMSFLQFTKDDIMRAIELAVMGAARPRGGAVRGAPAGAAHPDAGGAAAAPPRRACRASGAAGAAAAPPDVPITRRPARPPR